MLLVVIAVQHCPLQDIHVVLIKTPKLNTGCLNQDTQNSAEWVS